MNQYGKFGIIRVRREGGREGREGGREGGMWVEYSCCFC